jgi:hypothetical protein
MGGDMSIKRALITVITLAVTAVLSSGFSDSSPAATRRTAEPEVVESDRAKNTHEVPAEKVARGKRGRRVTRVDAWVASLEGDKKRIYERYGHPSGRHRVEKMGSVIEEWVYSDMKKTFRFKGNRLVR